MLNTPVFDKNIAQKIPNFVEQIFFFILTPSLSFYDDCT
jgi:hypothetical protein